MRTRLGLRLDRFAHKFLDRRLIFVMDVFISLCATILIAVVAYFLGVDQIESRRFTIVWGVSSLLSSAFMFYLLKTYTIVIRHFTFKDTLVIGLAVFGKFILMCACIAIFSEWSGAVPVLMFADGLVALVEGAGHGAADDARAAAGAQAVTADEALGLGKLNFMIICHGYSTSCSLLRWPMWM